MYKKIKRLKVHNPHDHKCVHSNHRQDSKCGMAEISHTQEDYRQEDNKKPKEIPKMPHRNRKPITRQNTAETYDEIVTTQSGKTDRKPDH